jgi:hypothetical protein
MPMNIEARSFERKDVNIMEKKMHQERVRKLMNVIRANNRTIHELQSRNREATINMKSQVGVLIANKSKLTSDQMTIIIDAVKTVRQTRGKLTIANSYVKNIRMSLRKALMEKNHKDVAEKLTFLRKIQNTQIELLENIQTNFEEIRSMDFSE